MNPRKIINFLLEHKSNLYSITKSDTDDYIQLVNYCKDKGLLTPSGNSYRKSATAIDLLQEDAEKTLDKKILEYLKYEKAVFKKIEIAEPFLFIDDSNEQRVELIQALEYLVKEKLIELDGYAPSLGATQGGQFPSKYHTGLKATITKLGEKEIEPQKLIEPVSSTTNFHIHGSPNSIVNSPINQNQSSLDLNNLSNNAPTNIPINTPKKISQKTLSEIGSDIFAFLIKNGGKIAVALLIAYLIFRLGWN
jgi:hypothetical protein